MDYPFLSFLYETRLRFLAATQQLQRQGCRYQIRQHAEHQNEFF
jgi:hypothetical protein